MNKYHYVDDPEPKMIPEDAEDRFIRKAGKVFNIIITVAFCVLAALFVFGLVQRYT